MAVGEMGRGCALSLGPVSPPAVGRGLWMEEREGVSTPPRVPWPPPDLPVTPPPHPCSEPGAHLKGDAGDGPGGGGGSATPLPLTLRSVEWVAGWPPPWGAGVGEGNIPQARAGPGCSSGPSGLS